MSSPCAFSSSGMRRMACWVMVCVLACAAWGVSGCSMPSTWPAPQTTLKCAVPVDLQLILDYSRSIWDSSPPGSWRHMIAFAQRFVATFTHPESRFSIITFNGDARLELSFTDKASVLSKLQCMMGYGKPDPWGTNIGKALHLANNQRANSGHASVYLVISDGREEFFIVHTPCMFCPSTLNTERATALSQGVHIATVEVGELDAQARAEITQLATSPDFFTQLHDFYSFDEKEFEENIIRKVCLWVRAVYPSLISEAQSQVQSMTVDLAGTALCTAKTNSLSCVYLSVGNAYDTGRLSSSAAGYDSFTDRLHCSMPSSGLTQGAYKIELQFASGQRTASSTAILTVQSTGCTCLNGGTCVWQNGYNVCICPPGWTGSQCQVQINECDSSPCMNGGYCTDLLNGYQCTCQTGYSGTNCQIHNGDTGCNPACQHGTCVSGECRCYPGWTGLACDRLIYDDCASSPCQNGGTCYNLPIWYAKSSSSYSSDTSAYCSSTVTSGCIIMRGYHCECPTGFFGTNCQEHTSPCDSYPCANGKCVDGINSFVCECDPGYSGRLCTEANQNFLLLGLSTIIICVLAVVLVLVLSCFFCVFCHLRRLQSDGRPRWMSYRDSCRKYWHSGMESFRRGWGSRREQHHEPQAYPAHTSAKRDYPREKDAHHNRHSSSPCHDHHATDHHSPHHSHDHSHDHSNDKLGSEFGLYCPPPPNHHCKHASIDQPSSHHGHKPDFYSVAASDCPRPSNQHGHHHVPNCEKPSIHMPPPMIQMQAMDSSHRASPSRDHDHEFVENFHELPTAVHEHDSGRANSPSARCGNAHHSRSPSPRHSHGDHHHDRR